MKAFDGRLYADSQGISRLSRLIDASRFGDRVSIPDDMPFLSALIDAVPFLIEQSEKAALKRRNRSEKNGFWYDLPYSTRQWVRAGKDVEEQAERAEWSMAAREELRRILPRAGVPVAKSVQFEGHGRHEELVGWYLLDRSEIWTCIYYFGLSLDNTATHVLAVWLQGGHAIDWEGTFPDGQIVGYFFGGSPRSPGVSK